MTSLVALSTDLGNDYEFFLPLAAAVWSKRIGFQTVAVCVGSESLWRANPLGDLVLRELEPYRRAIAFVPPLKGYRTSNTAQIARMYAFLARGVEPADILTTSDIDMWPLDRAWFQENQPAEGMVTAYYGNFPSRFPMSYVAANARTWTEMLLKPFPGLTPPSTVAWHVQQHLRQFLSPQAHPVDAWQHDEEWLTARIHGMRSYVERCKLVVRPSGEPFPDRIDRVQWPDGAFSLEGKRDAHLLRPGHVAWPRMRSLFALLCPDLVDWADNYVRSYTAVHP